MNSLRILWFIPPPLAVVADAFRLNTVTLQAERNTNSDVQFEALAAGRVDLVVTSMDNVMDWNLRPGPGDFRIIAQLERTIPLSVVGQRRIAALQDLRAAKLLVDAPHNGFVVVLRALLAEAGLGPDTYAMKPAGGVKERYDALLAGRGDATLLGAPFDAMAIEAGFNRITTVQEHYPAFPGQGVVVSASALDRLRPGLRAWLLALQGAAQCFSSDPEAAKQALVLAGYPLSAFDAIASTMPTTLQPNRAGVELLIAQRRAAGLRGAETDYESLVDASVLAGVAPPPSPS
jgi:ABC-type nitrate/sulfonate/bicarbonate transport system substrate-binding protein